MVSLFDVSDDENPTLVAKLPLGPQATSDSQWVESYSPVSGDARAFTIWGDTIVVPIGWWSYNENPESYEENNGASAVLVRVDDDNATLTRIGEVSHPKTRECEGGFYPAEEEGVTVELESASSTGSDGESSDGESGDAEADFVRDDEEPAELVPAPTEPGREQYCFTYQPEIRRSVIIGDNLYTVSDAGVAVNTFDGLDTVTWIPFNR